MQIGAFDTTNDAVRQIYKQKGLRGFYAGFSSFVLRDIPFSAIQFPTYEYLKIFSIKRAAAKTNKKESEIVTSGISNSINGAIAGTTAGFFTTPMDVVKTKSMTFQS